MWSPITYADLKSAPSKYLGNNCAMTYGHFSTLHPGHLRYLRHAKSLADQLITVVIGDKDHAYPFSGKERCDALQTLGISDLVILLE